MAEKIRVQDDVAPPVMTLCWKPSGPPEMARCDRRTGHDGLHTWEMLRLLNMPMPRTFVQNEKDL